MQKLTNTLTKISGEIVIFCYNENDIINRDTCMQNVINCIIYEAKWQIWKHRHELNI